MNIEWNSIALPLLAAGATYGSVCTALEEVGASTEEARAEIRNVSPDYADGWEAAEKVGYVDRDPQSTKTGLGFSGMQEGEVPSFLVSSGVFKNANDAELALDGTKNPHWTKGYQDWGLDHPEN